MEQFIIFIITLFFCNAIINILVIRDIPRNQLILYMVEITAEIFIASWGYFLLCHHA